MCGGVGRLTFIVLWWCKCNSQVFVGVHKKFDQVLKKTLCSISRSQIHKEEKGEDRISRTKLLRIMLSDLMFLGRCMNI